MHTLMRTVMRALVTAPCLLSAASIACADGSPTARVHSFAALPDWTGIWLSAAWPLGANGRVTGGEAQLRASLQLIRPPPYNPEWAEKYTAGTRDPSFAEKSATFKVCTRSFPSLMEAPYMFETVVLPEETLLVFENDQVRHIHTDGRDHPAADDLWPTRLGDSAGRWEGDTLVVDTIARMPSEPLAVRAWASMLSDHSHFTERIRMTNRNELDDELTIEDPVALARPWHITLKFKRVTELDRLIPQDCTENDRNPVVDGKLIITSP